MDNYFKVLICLLLSLIATPLFGQDDSGGFSRTPPVAYAEHLQPIMTDVMTLLPATKGFDPKVSDGVVLLFERIMWIDDSGKTYDLRQAAYTAVTDSSIDDISEDVFVFRPDEGQRIYLLDAKTIQPDGEVLSVHGSGAFVQTPQREARQRIYSGRKELKVVFPDVKAGSTTYICVLIESERGRIPGEFTASNGWSSGWPRYRNNYVLDAPKELVERMTIASRGIVPPMSRGETLPGRERLQWRAADIPKRKYEEFGGSVHDVGPYLKLSSLKDWDAFASWYADLVLAASQIPDDLRQQVEVWTDGIESPDEIIRVLFEKVANDIRYTSINFGNGGVAPQQCSVVWLNKYGDCKDKATLLRGLLALKGIRAHVALVNTDHLGLVEKQTPDYASFTHAIVAVDDGQGGYLFCDPTLAFAAPGILSPGSSGRDVLVVDETQRKGIWVRTPEAGAGSINAEFELVLEPDATLRGWLTYVADGYYGSSYMDRYRTSGRNQIKDSVRNLLLNFYRDAEVIDFEHTAVEDWAGRFVLKVYFLVPGVAGADARETTLAMPDIKWLLPYLGTEREITRDAYIYPEQIQVQLQIAYPEGWAVQELPRPFQFAVAGSMAQAGYSVADSRVSLSLRAGVVQPRLTPADFTPQYNAIQSLNAWLAQAVIIRKAESVGTAGSGVKGVQVGTADFPVMPTARGQLDLALNRFSKTKDRGRARQAIEAVIQYFPKDNAVVFDAGMYLAIMDWEDDREADALQRINGLIDTYSRSLESENIGWALYIKGLSLRDLGRLEEAQQVFESIAADESLSGFRRSWAESMCGRILRVSDPTSSVACFRRAFDFRDTDRPYHFYSLAIAMFEDGQQDQLLQILKDVQAQDAEEMQALLVTLLERVEQLREQQEWNLLTSMNEVMDQLNASAILGESQAAPLQALRYVAQSRMIKEQLRGEIAAYLEQTPPSFWTATAPDAALVTREDFKAAVARFQEQKDADNAIRHLLEQVLRFEPDEDFYTCIWRAAAFANQREVRAASAMDEPLSDDLLRFGERIPSEDDAFYEILFQRGGYYRNRSDFTNELAAYQKIQALEPRDEWLAALWQRMGYAAENAKDYAAALQTYAMMLPLQTDGSLLILDVQSRAILIHLNRGEPEQALAVIRALAAIDNQQIGKSAHVEHIREWISLIGQEDALQAYWMSWEAWWPQWQALAAAIGAAAEVGSVYRIADAEDTKGLHWQLNEAVRLRNSELFAETLSYIVDLARWQPERINELLLVSGNIASAFPQNQKLWREFIVTLYEASEGMSVVNADPNALLWYVVSLLELERAADAKLKLEAFFATNPERDDNFHSANRLYSLAAVALNEDLARAAGYLEEDLAQGTVSSRAATVACLADIYSAQGDTEAERELLKREIDNPRVKADTVRLARLKTRYEEILYSVNLKNNFKDATQQWLDSYAPKWLAYAKPYSLADPKLKNLAAVLDSEESSFSEAELIKLKFLALDSTELDIDTKIDLFWRNILLLYSLNESTQDWYASIDAVTADSRIPESSRSTLVMMSVLTAQQMNDFERVEAIYANRESYPFGQRQLVYIESLHSAMNGLDFDSVESLTTLAERLIAKGSLNVIDVESLMICINGLVSLGDIESAKVIYAKIAGVALEADSRMGKPALQMLLLRTIRSASKLQPVHEVFRGQVLALLEGEAEFDVDAFRQQRLNEVFLEPLEIRSQQMQWQVRAGMLAANNFRRSDLGFWNELLELYIDTNPGRSMDVVSIYAAAIEAAPDDDVRAQLLMSLIYCVDYDDENVQLAVEPLLARWRNDPANRKARDLIRAEDVHIAMRKGEVLDSEQLSGIRHPFVPLFPTHMTLSYYYINNEPDKLKRELLKLDADKLTEPLLLKTMLVCLSLVQMEDELELVKEAAREQVYEDVLNSWSNIQIFSAMRAAEIADLLDEPELIPQGFREHVSNIANVKARMMIQVALAEMDKDWPALQKVSSEMVAAYPTFYDYYWHLAHALCQQGELSAAVEPLRLFIAHSGDSMYLPEAREWLKRAEAPGAQ